ncbi:MAG: sodium:neurotransmitter symporter [Bacteroidetes bacterium]|nr:MAG: sodium:neurotransmitter symporter [Bacteroidota bacterium]
MNKEQWGSRAGLVFAMAGNAVGLGNFLRFPVQAIQNGGGAFIIPYLVSFLLMGIPLLLVEWSIGRFGGSFGHHATPFQLHRLNKMKIWKYVGVFGLFTNIAVASYYCYLESWTITWVFHGFMRTFEGMTSLEVATYFDNYVSLDHTGIPIVVWIFTLILNTWILSRGLEGGVEKVAKIGMPLLILFGIFLAVKAFLIKAGNEGAIFDASEGLNFLWTPDFSTIWSAKVWLAAAGQIFFTLSLGMGSIHCYSSYVSRKDDIALNAMSAGWMNEFVEVVLGSAILIPISVGYLGIENVIALTTQGGLGLGFKTLPFLFEQWGPLMASLAGLFWFGLLFFAGITSSLAMGTPVMGFFMDEFNWKRKNAAWFFGLLIFIFGFPTVIFFKYGVFDEFDYWAGTVALVFFALFEIILFAWIFGIDKGWQEIKTGADIRLPELLKYVIKYVTPIFLLVVFIGSLPGIWDKLTNKALYSQLVGLSDPAMIHEVEKTIYFVNASRLLLLLLFVGISFVVYKAYKKNYAK